MLQGNHSLGERERSNHRGKPMSRALYLKLVPRPDLWPELPTHGTDWAQ